MPFYWCLSLDDSRAALLDPKYLSVSPHPPVLSCFLTAHPHFCLHRSLTQGLRDQARKQNSPLDELQNAASLTTNTVSSGLALYSSIFLLKKKKSLLFLYTKDYEQANPAGHHIPDTAELLTQN